MTTFDVIKPGQAFRFVGGSSVFIKIDDWKIKGYVSGGIYPINGEYGHASSANIIRCEDLDETIPA